VYRYESPVTGNVQEYDNKVISVGESYSSFNEMILNMNGWISIKVKDMFLDSRDTQNQENVLQLYKILKEINLSDEVLAGLNHWVLTQLNEIDVVSEDEKYPLYDLFHSYDYDHMKRSSSKYGSQSKRLHRPY
jgi:hypothetical protein